ncbi:MAG TPA: VWA domain-containing protein [Vicinamibacterales bacterium]|nr:VWA domain-containing protein [Vicinamibacterales bacterium]
MRSRILILSTLFFLVPLAPAGQPQDTQPPPPASADPQPPVRFKVEVNYVEIDAIVTDANGNFVRTLTKGDFEVFEDGKPQSVSMFSLVDLPVEPTDPPLFATAPIEPDVASNAREFDGRVFVLILDDLHTHSARSLRVKAAARQFVERHVGANDLVAILTTGGGRGTAQEFTSSKPRLLKAIDAFMGQKLRSATLERIDDYYRQRDMRSGNAPRDPGEAERAFKARNTLATLESVANYMTGIRGRRKAVLFFSEGIDYDITNPIQNQYASDIMHETQDAIAAATRANVSFYGIDARGLGALSDEIMSIQSLPEDNSIGLTNLQNELRLSQDSLRVISDETGGFAAVNRNEFADTFTRIVRENSSYYVLGYYSSDTRRDGRFRRLEVRVRQPGLQVRARKGYVAPRGRPASETPVNAKTSPELREAVDSPIPVTGLGLRVFAAPLKGREPNASVLLALEVEGARLRFTPKGEVMSDDIEVAVVAIDQTGKVRDGGRNLAELRLRPQTQALVAQHGVRLTRRLDVPPGRYQLRVGARDAGSGLLGSVTLDLDVPDFSKGDLAMSGILLTSASASRMPTANPDPDFKDILPAPPAAAREFPHGDTLSLFTEVYDNRVSTPHRVTIRATMLADDGRVIFTTADERRSEELKGGGGYGYVTTIPLTGVAPGRYVLRVEAQSFLSGGSAISRELEFRVR